MAKSKDQILEQKEFLASETLKIANEALGYLQDQLSECNTRDLVAIFNSTVKAHRDIVADILVITEKESKNEQDLAKDYEGTVDQLLKKLMGGE